MNKPLSENLQNIDMNKIVIFGVCAKLEKKKATFKDLICI